MPLERHFYCCHSVCRLPADRQFTMATRGYSLPSYGFAAVLSSTARTSSSSSASSSPGLTETENAARRNFVFYCLEDEDVPISSALKRRRFERPRRTKGKWIISSLYSLGESYGCKRLQLEGYFVYDGGHNWREKDERTRNETYIISIFISSN